MEKEKYFKGNLDFLIVTVNKINIRKCCGKL